MRLIISRIFVFLAVCISFSASAATITYPQSFSTGWNLAGNSTSTPIDVKTVFGAQTGITSIWKWDAAGMKWAFYAPTLDVAGTLVSYAASKGYSVLVTINPGEGFWLNASTPVALGTLSGTGFSLAAVNLAANWNLSATGDDIAPATFTTNVGNVTTLWSWDNLGSVWYFYAPALAVNNTLASYLVTKGYRDFGVLTLGKGLGFWVNYAGVAGGAIATAPVAPIGVTAAANSTTQISINWANVPGATSYNIYRSTLPGVQIVPGNKIPTAALSAAGPIADSGLTAATPYYYKVTAVNASGESLGSTEVSATTQAVAPMAILSIVGSNTVGSQLMIVLGGLTSTTASSYRVDFGGGVSALASQVSVPAGVLYVSIPAGAITGAITITDLSTNATASLANFAMAPSPAPVCSGGGVTATLPASGVVGANWSNCSNQSPGNVKVVWGNNEFVGNTKSSTNGYTWITNGNPFSKVAFNGTRWVGARTLWSTTQLAYSATSSSSSTWTTINVPLSSPGQLMDIFAVNGRFFVSTNNGSFLTSTDGITWVETATGLCGQSYLQPVYAGNVSKILWHNSKYLMYVGNSAVFQQELACTSTDGLTWTSTPLTFSPATISIPNPNGGRALTLAMAFVPTAYDSNGTQLVTLHWSSGAAGSDVWTSLDGIAWTKAPGLAPFDVNIKDMVWTGSQFVALGAGIGSINTNAADTIATSIDGLTWVAQTSGSTNYSMNNLVYSPTLNRLLMTGANGLSNALFVSP